MSPTFAAAQSSPARMNAQARDGGNVVSEIDGCCDESTVDSGGNGAIQPAPEVTPTVGRWAMPSLKYRTNRQPT